MLAPHPAARLEYWFFKVNAGPLALLVDGIAHRDTNERTLRASVYSPQDREVLLEREVAPTPHDPTFLNPTFLTTARAAGRVGNVEWKLTIEPGRQRVRPRVFPFSQLGAPDMALVSAPQAMFSGWIRHGDYRADLQRAPGMLGHYWGRQLPREWWWLSANQFDQPGVTVECMLLRSGLWALPLGVRMGYLYLRHPAGRREWIAPPALARVTGTPEAFEVRFRRLRGGAVRLVAAGRDYADLGDGIVNTLVGDLEVWDGDRLIGRAAGTAGLERRAPEA